MCYAGIKLHYFWWPPHHHLFRYCQDLWQNVYTSGAQLLPNGSDPACKTMSSCPQGSPQVWKFGNQGTVTISIATAPLQLNFQALRDRWHGLVCSAETMGMWGLGHMCQIGPQLCALDQTQGLDPACGLTPDYSSSLWGPNARHHWSVLIELTYGHHQAQTYWQAAMEVGNSLPIQVLGGAGGRGMF